MDVRIPPKGVACERGCGLRGGGLWVESPMSGRVLVDRKGMCRVVDESFWRHCELVAAGVGANEWKVSSLTKAVFP